NWADFLPPEGRPCPPEFVFYLLGTDIEARIKSGLPALLAQPYFDDPRLTLDDARKAELIRWEYQQRWQRGDRAARADYQVRFPDLAWALQDLRPSWNCPRCRRKGLALEETAEAAWCPSCGQAASVAELFPTLPTSSSDLETPPPVPPGYEILG